MRRLSVGFIAILLASACGTRDESWSLEAARLGPVVAAGNLVYVQVNAGVLTALDPASETPALHVDVTPNARFLVSVPGGVVLVGGKGVAPVLEHVALPEGTRKRHALPGAYDRVAASASGRFVVLTYDPFSPPVDGGPAARNNNEITIVDLENDVLHTFVLRTESFAPQSVVFSPTGDLAAVLLDSAVAFIELANPALRVLVPLKVAGGRTLTPQKALFSQDGAFLFIKSANTDDVLALDVVRTDGEIGSAINFLFYPGATGLQDILVLDGPGFERSVAALYSASTGKSNLVLLDGDGDTSKTRSAALSRRLTSLADIGAGRVVAWSDPERTRGDSARAVAGWMPLLDLADEDLLQGPVKATPRFSEGGAFFPHGAVGERSALTGLTLEHDGARLRVRLAPMVLGGTPTATTLDADGGTLFLSVNVDREKSGAAEGGYGGVQVASIVALQADSLAIGGLTLDAKVESLGVVGTHLYSVHPAAFGDVTFTPLGTLNRDASRRVVGFLAGGLADRGGR